MNTNCRYIVGWLSSSYLERVNKEVARKFLADYYKISPEKVIEAKTREEAKEYYNMLTEKDGNLGFIFDKASKEVEYRRL